MILKKHHQQCRSGSYPRSNPNQPKNQALRTHPPAPKQSTGFTYIGILLTIALLSTTLAVAGNTWSLSSRRGNEKQLIFIGQAYRKAIASYYNATPLGAHQYPTSISDLILDTRGTKPARHLRERYADPLTGTTDWELLTFPDGSIFGVASRATGTPLKQSNFSVWEETFEGAKCFCNWRFVYLPDLINSSG